jgi:predicted Zn-ribbon and HTH transcriptional regulator
MQLQHCEMCSFVDLHVSCGCLCIKVRSEWIGEPGLNEEEEDAGF